MRKIYFSILLIILSISAKADGTIDYILKSDYENAYKTASANLEKEKTAEKYYDLCSAVFYLHDLKQAKAYCNSALNILDAQKHPDKELKSDVLMQMGNIYSDYYKNREVTLDYFNLAKDLKETNPQRDEFSLAGLYSSMGHIYYQTGKKDVGDMYYEKALKLCPADNQKFNFIKADIYFKMAKYYYKENDFQKAKENDLNALNELNEAKNYKNVLLEAEIYMHLAKITEQYGKNKEEIKKYYNKSYELNKTYPRVEFTDMKETDIKSALKEYPYDAGLNIELGEIMLKYREGNPKKHFNAAINLNRNNPDIYLYVAKAYADNYSKEMYFYKAEAQRYINTALQKAPYSKDVYNKAAEIYKILKMDREANSLLKKSKALT